VSSPRVSSVPRHRTAAVMTQGEYAQRKPMWRDFAVGSLDQLFRSAAAWDSNEPPRTEKLRPASLVHSATLPVRSSTPSGEAPSGRDPASSAVLPPWAQGPPASPKAARRQTRPLLPQAK